MTSKLAETLGNAISSLNTTKDDLTGTGSAVGYGDQISGNITPEHRTTIVVEKDLDGSTLFWNDTNQGTWNTNYWAGSDPTDGYSSIEWIQVLNKNNTFEENFDIDTFIDDSSTGTLTLQTGLTNGYYTLQDGEFLLTKLIARDNNIYTNVSVELTGTNIDEATTTIYNNGTSGIYIKIDNLASGGLTFPLTFPATFPSADDVIIETITVKYS